MRSSSLFLGCLTVILLHAAAAAVGAQVAGEVTNAGAKAAVRDPIRLLHERLQEFDAELQSRLIRLARNAAAGRATEATLQEEAERFRRHLESLEHECHRLGPEVEASLRAKLRGLGNLVANLERAAEVGPNPLPPIQPTHDRRDPGRVVRTPTAAETAPPNDDCADAIVIGDGIVFGDTSEATNDGQARCGSSFYSPDVWFKYVAGDWGYVSADTFGSAFDTVVSIHTACPGTLTNQITCNDDAYGLQSAAGFWASAGEEYWLRVSGFDQATGIFQLHVGPRGAISGTVTDAATGEPLPGGRVEAWNLRRYYEGSGTAEISGEYTISGLDCGTYFLTTIAFAGYLDELYDDLPCSGAPYGCQITAGTPVAVITNTVTTGIGFELDKGGVISGQVTASATADPLPDVRVEIYDSGGSEMGFDYTDAAGNYSVGGLATGSYLASAESSEAVNEVYEDIPCAGGSPWDCDPTAGTPIAVSINATTAGIDFVLDRLGVISGTVTDAATGDPISGVGVKILDSDGDYFRHGDTDASGAYRVGGLTAGTWFAVASSPHFAAELYDDVPCAGGCDATTGTSIEVAINATTAGIDFALDRLGNISGTVTEAASGNPIPYIRIGIWNASGSEVKSAYADSGGKFTTEGLATGTYFAATNTYHHFVNELYQELPCPDGPNWGCDPTTGTPITVTLSATTAGIDFTLDRRGAISGTVTAAATGDPLSSVKVRISNAAGSYADYRYTDSSGDYEVTGLDVGSYYATTEHSSYVDELYDDLPCPGGGSTGCDPTTGTAIAVALNATTSGIDFALELGGAISGTVTESATSEPVPWVGLDIWDGTGLQVGYGGTDSAGNYTVTGLAAGTYYATTASYYCGYSDELYDDLPCLGGGSSGCDPTTGTPIAVTLGATASGVDFALDRLGAISGTVTDAVTGDPMRNVEVEIWNAAGSRVERGYTDSSGNYTVSRLAAGTYFATADTYDYLDELYDNLPCPGGGSYGCEPTTGTPISVSNASTTSGIDFVLDRFGALAGTVTAAVNGAPLTGVRVRLSDAGGSTVRSTSTDVAGVYTFSALASGTYYVTTSNDDDYLDELYDDIPCLGGAGFGCTPTKGTPVEVTVNTTTRHIHFALEFLDLTSGIAGTVTDGSSGLAAVFVDAWHGDGLLARSTLTGVAGDYLLELDPGIYFVSTDNGRGLPDEVYDDLLCLSGPASLGLCDPTQGTPIAVGELGVQLVTGIDFALGVVAVFRDGFESGDLSAWSSVVAGQGP